MIDDGLRQELVNALLRVPGIDKDYHARSLLLVGVPNSNYRLRIEDSASRDIEAIILQLEDSYSVKGDWFLLYPIDKVLRQVEDTDLGDNLRLLRKQLTESAPASIRSSPGEYAKPYRFDLLIMVKLCLVALLEKQPKLSGFLVHTQSLKFMENFCEGLKHRGHEDGAWDRAKVVSLPVVVEVDLRHTSVATVIAKVACVNKLLTKNVVILGLKLVDASDVPPLWEGISAAFPKELDNHLIVLMGVPEGCPAPSGAVELPPPSFQRQHVVAWVKEIVATLRWSDSLIPDCVEQIVTLSSGDAADGGLPVERVYFGLEKFRKRLQDCSTEDAFRLALQEMQDIGELYAITY